MKNIKIRSEGIDTDIKDLEELKLKVKDLRNKHVSIIYNKTMTGMKAVEYVSINELGEVTKTYQPGKILDFDDMASNT